MTVSSIRPPSPSPTGQASSPGASSYWQNLATRAASMADGALAEVAYFFYPEEARVPELVSAHSQPQTREPPRKIDDALEPALANLNDMELVGLVSKVNVNLTPEQLQRKELDKSDEDLKKQREIFIENASVWMAISWIAWVTNKPIDDELLMELMKEASLKSEGNKVYLWEAIQAKDYYAELGFIDQCFGRFICWVASHALLDALEGVCKKILDFASKGLENNATLLELGVELSKIINLHVGKYLKALETFVQGQDKEGSIDDHIAEELSKIRGQMESEIYSDFSKVFCKHFLPYLTLVKRDGTWMKFFLWCLSGLPLLILWPIYHLYIRLKGFPQAIHSLLHSSASATQFKPASYALNCTLEPLLNDLKRRLRTDSASSSDVPDVQEPLTKQNLREAASKLLKILDLEPFHTRNEMARVLQGLPESSGLSEQLMSAFTKLNYGKTVDELVHDAMEGGMRDILILGFNFFLEPVKAKQALANMMRAFNAVFDKNVLRTSEAFKEWNRKYNEKQKTVQKICESIVDMFLERSAFEIVNGPPADEQQKRLKIEADFINKKVSEMLLAVHDPMRRFASSLDASSPELSKEYLKTLKTAMETLTSSLYVRDRSGLSEAAYKKLQQAIDAISQSLTRLTQYLLQIQEKLHIKEYSLEMRGVKDMALKKMQMIPNLLAAKDPRSRSEMQEVNDLITGIQAKYSFPDDQEMQFPSPNRTMSNSVEEHQLNQIALEKLMRLGTNGPLPDLAEMIKRSINERRPPSTANIDLIDQQIRDLLRFLIEPMKSLVLEAVDQVKQATTTEELSSRYAALERVLAESAESLNRRMSVNITIFEESITEWNRSADALIQRSQALVALDTAEIQGKLSSLQQEFSKISELQRGLISLELPAEESTIGSTIGWIGSTVVTAFSSLIAALGGFFLAGPAGAAGGAAIAGTLANSRAVSSSVQGGVGGSVDSFVNTGKRYTVHEIIKVVTPKLTKKIDSLYHLFQSSNTVRGLGNASLASAVTYFDR